MICLDASVVGMLISPDESSEEILRRYETARLQGETFLAPTLLPYEIASLLRKKQLRKLLSGTEVLGAIHFYRGLKIQLVDFEGLVERSLALSTAFGKSLTVYDASYLAVAEQRQASLWTADKTFFDTISISFSDALLIT